jgi:hypothetical protein
LFLLNDRGLNTTKTETVYTEILTPPAWPARTLVICCNLLKSTTVFPEVKLHSGANTAEKLNHLLYRNPGTTLDFLPESEIYQNHPLIVDSVYHVKYKYIDLKDERSDAEEEVGSEEMFTMWFVVVSGTLLSGA